ncbi:MAG: hypothetical protein LBU51_03760, partial [Bacteroidales bacterium]|nr:hypothetical protein [Bacteroidales bacterium]
SRVSDGITIATLFKVPILIEDQLFNSISYSNETFLTNSYSGDIYDNKDIFFAGKLKEMSDHQLNNLLRGAIEVEDYELAAQIQKEITERRFV